MTLPPERRIVNARTFAASWSPAAYACALERPAPSIWRLICNLFWRS